MLKEARLTLYDIFGFLLPGTVFFAALVIFFRSIYYPNDTIQLQIPSAEIGVLLLVVAYLCGHFAQALAVALMGILAYPIQRAQRRFLSWQWIQKRCWFFKNESIYLDPRFEDTCASEKYISGAKARFTALTGVELEGMKPESMFRLLDELVVQRGKTGDREIFQYREGFYRGMWFALFALFLSLLVHLHECSVVCEIPGLTNPLPLQVQWFFIVVSGFAALLCYSRFRRFSRYRVNQTLCACITLSVEKEKKKDVSEPAE